MKMFDLLIANIDRNQGNLIYDADWHLFLIDHSRAFIDKKDLKGIAPLGRVDRKLWEKMQALTLDDLEIAASTSGWATRKRKPSSSGATGWPQMIKDLSPSAARRPCSTIKRRHALGLTNAPRRRPPRSPGRRGGFPAARGAEYAAHRRHRRHPRQPSTASRAS